MLTNKAQRRPRNVSLIESPIGHNENQRFLKNFSKFKGNHREKESLDSSRAYFKGVLNEY